MGRVQDLTKELKRHDSELYACDSGRDASKGTTGAIWICRRNRARPHEPHFIFALTDDWSAKGKPVEWGILPILERIKAMDLWRDDSFVERYLAQAEKRAASERRAFGNNVESFLKDFRRQFARATDSINTSLLPKLDARRTGDIKYGS